MMQDDNQIKGVECWGLFELELKGPERCESYNDLDLTAAFTCKGRTVTVNGFYDGQTSYKIRFMPDLPGEWRYVTSCSLSELDGHTGTLTCCEAAAGNHGPVRVRNTYHFAYEDGTAYYPFGTTAYAWTHQTDELEAQTIQTLKSSAFNKIRMCVFPKHYDYNHNEPVYYPFAGSLETGFDFAMFNPAFFAHLEARILDLQQLGIEADLILFHAYDRWGFSTMKPEDDDRYVRYLVNRLSAFRNVWWSLANEYDLMALKEINPLANKLLPDWERFARIIQDNDPYQHLRSIHNCFDFYDHSRPWITHCSIQRVDVYKTAELVNEWRDRYRKPIVVDECAYEGNITHGWGNITGQEMVRRFWEGTLRGGYVGHGETYWNPQEILWWSKGGQLVGSSPERIAFLRDIVEKGPVGGINPVPKMGMFDWDVPVGGAAGEYYLYYFGFYQPAFREFHLPEGPEFEATIIDTWEMTTKMVSGTFSGSFTIELPGKPYIAVQLTRA